MRKSDDTIRTEGFLQGLLRDTCSFEWVKVQDISTGNRDALIYNARKIKVFQPVLNRDKLVNFAETMKLAKMYLIMDKLIKGDWK